MDRKAAREELMERRRDAGIPRREVLIQDESLAIHRAFMEELSAKAACASKTAKMATFLGMGLAIAVVKKVPV